jgi:hypothetical protein
MIVNDYKTVVDVSKITEQSTRNVRRIINRIKDEVDDRLLFKDEEQSTWNIHKDLLHKFKPQRIRANKFYALTIDPCVSVSEKDLHSIMKYVIELMGDTHTEIHYVVEQKKKAPHLNHIHCFVKCSNKRKLIQNFRLAFSTLSYHQSAIFDLESWKGYITKENNEIKTIKN